MDAISVGTEGILKPSSHGGASDSNDVKDASVNLRYLTLIYDRFKSVNTVNANHPHEKAFDFFNFISALNISE